MHLSLCRYFHSKCCFYRCSPITHELEVTRENFENKLKAQGDREEERESLSEPSHYLVQNTEMWNTTFLVTNLLKNQKYWIYLLSYSNRIVEWFETFKCHLDQPLAMNREESFVYIHVYISCSPWKEVKAYSKKRREFEVIDVTKLSSWNNPASLSSLGFFSPSLSFGDLQDNFSSLINSLHEDEVLSFWRINHV